MAQPLYEVIVKDSNLLDVFRELGLRMSFGLVVNNTKAMNFDAKFITVTFTVVNTQHRVRHGLARVPQGGFVVMDFVKGSVSGVRVEATASADSTFLYLKCAEAVPVTFLVW